VIIWIKGLRAKAKDKNGPKKESTLPKGKVKE